MNSLNDHENRPYELVDGVLVEKVMGFPETWLALEIARLLGNFVKERNLGILAGVDGTLRLAPELVRIPDVSFIAWDRLPDDRIAKHPIPLLSPDLAIEVLSPSNTAKEMGRKLRDYFEAGVRLVWYFDPDTRTVTVHQSLTQSTVLGEAQALEGGDVLPGFRLPLRGLFDPPSRPTR